MIHIKRDSYFFCYDLFYTCKLCDKQRKTILVLDFDHRYQFHGRFN